MVFEKDYGEGHHIFSGAQAWYKQKVADWWDEEPVDPT
eukprot:CAMPEP_0205828090 /NCGR_PEP_ID=MMETSP0206-20130828/34048_1 /ASSEMBLY_ACC=CAM_ASM_000279 /TAXON_ID=36767 /ORGANISM="Euplotes focardii, Strain TN1" /LENGTH=37 /DNA_ID= /DNA_START= /DNA_END= /DNA_ORIENTATION=